MKKSISKKEKEIVFSFVAYREGNDDTPDAEFEREKNAWYCGRSNNFKSVLKKAISGNFEIFEDDDMGLYRVNKDFLEKLVENL